MGRSGVGPSQWSRWHDLGGKVLVLLCQQTRQQPSSFTLKGSFSLSSVRESLSAVPCEARIHKNCFPSSHSTSFTLKGSFSLSSVRESLSAVPCEARIHKNCFPSSHSTASKCGIVEVRGKVESVSSVRHGKQQHVFSERTFSTAIQYPSRNATSVGNGGPNPLRAVEDRSMAANFKISCSQCWLHRSGLRDVQTCGRTRSMSIANTAGYPDGAEQPSIEIVDQELAYPIFPSRNNWSTSAKSVRRGGVGMSNAILDTGMDMPFMSRASKLPLHSALPSLRTHRLGEATLLGLQVFEAAASMPAGDVVDWQQQRLGRLRDYDPRPRPQHSSPHSDAEPDDMFIPVKAFYISRSVDLKSLAREPFLEVTSSRNNLIIRCADRPPHSPVTADNPEMTCLGFLKERYLVAFQYGSVVFFNFGDHEEVEFLDVVRKYCSDEFWEARKDDYGVLVRHTLAEWCEGGHDRVMLRKLDIDNIRVISSILGQSIALDHYAKKVDEMVTTFSELNRGMEQTGTFTMTRKSLFQLVAAANTTLADVILRLGLLERSDAAWKDANYAQIWEYLRDDFELDERFESLDFKLNIIQHNVRFFLEILQNRKSGTLDWIIIILLVLENFFSLYDILHTAGGF